MTYCGICEQPIHGGDLVIRGTGSRQVAACHLACRNDVRRPSDAMSADDPRVSTW
jgi:hypothetical protein